MNIKNKIAAASASAVILSGVLVNGAFASTNITISGNLKKSENKVTVKNSKVTKVTQSNSQVVNTVVNSSASTGGNKANDNMGDVTVSTGKATSHVTVAVGGNANTATFPCGCEETDTTVQVKNNGKKSKNTVNTDDLVKSIAAQVNAALVGTGVGSDAATGDNKANANGGNATVDVSTGVSNSTVAVVVEGSVNVLE